MTRDMWKKVFDEEFAKCGAMFRGEPPYGKLEKISEEEIFKASCKKVHLRITDLKIENLPDHIQKFALKICPSGQQKTGPAVLKVKGPKQKWHNQSKGISNFKFDTECHAFLHFDLYNQKCCMCCATKQSFGIHNYPLLQVVENTTFTSSTVQTITENLPLQEGDNEQIDGLSASVTARIDPPRRGPCVLTLLADTFQSYTIPEDVEQLWGPIPLARLPEGVDNTCIVASHR